MINSPEKPDYWVYDLETTGLDKSNDRICEISWILMDWQGKITQYKRQLLNPTIPIPPEATAIHGIKNSDILGEPTFEEFAPEILAILDERDPLICGYNNDIYDDQILENEFERIGREIKIREWPGVDVLALYKKFRPRNLEYAANDILGEERVQELAKRHADMRGMENKKDAWHSSLFDAVVTGQVMFGLFHKYKDQIPQSWEEFSRWLTIRDDSWIDMDGKFAYNENGQACVNFGKKWKGSPVVYVMEEDPGYFKWMLGAGFSNDTKHICQKIIDGEPPPHR